MEESSDIRTHFRSCAFCEAACGIEVTADHKSHTITHVRGDKLDPYSKGFICPKAYALTELHGDPDRLRKPLRRKGRDFEEISFDVAIAEAGDRLKSIQRAHGRNAVGYYFGNPTGHKGPMLIYGGLLIGALGSMQVYSPGTLDQIPKFLSAALMFGGPMVQPIPDMDRTDYMIVIGSNPVVSQGSMVVAPGMGKRLEAIRARGGRLVVIDPRCTETAKIADEYVAIKPGTDAYLLFAMVDVLMGEGLVKLGRAANQVKNFDELKQIAAEFPPERAAALTGIPSETIRRLAREFAAAEKAIIYGRTGTCTQRFGTIASWLLDALVTITGNLDKPGGSMFAGYGIPTPILFSSKWENGVPPVGRWHSRATHLPEAIGMLPTAALANEMLTPGEGRVRGFVTQAGNLLLSNPNGAKLAEAFDSLDFMLSLDIYLNETTRHADIIIPGPSYVEHSDFAAVTPFEMMRKYTKWAPPILEKPEGQLEDWEIFAGLAARIQGITVAEIEEKFVRANLASALAKGRPECADVDIEEARAAIGDKPGADRIFDAMIRSGPYGDAFGRVPDGLTLERVAQHVHGLDLGPLDEKLPGVIETPDGLIDLAPTLIVEDVERLRAWTAGIVDPNQLLMIGRRITRTKNAWMHNMHVLMKGKNACTLKMHPADAESRGLKSGDQARVTTHVGQIEAPVEVSDELMQGVVSLPHGWGHHMAETRQRIANANPGSNYNFIVDEMGLDVPSATTILNGVAVTVDKLQMPDHAASSPSELAP